MIGNGPASVKASKDENIGPARAIGTATLVAGDQPQRFQVIQAVAQLALAAAARLLQRRLRWPAQAELIGKVGDGDEHKLLDRIGNLRTPISPGDRLNAHRFEILFSRISFCLSHSMTEARR
ncbi:hypothetical protein PsAD14_03637 [Pseudovibrio sp. Ad14]|nr:hypothetical protein PsW74_04057 [Pseudovibrio sp. W74]KZL07255.1 hypothetical protein PsAD14_03637 [Pseudovibrio sp. Ad14]